MRLKNKFDLTESYEGHALRRISEIMTGKRCVYCLGPVTRESPKTRIGGLAVCSHTCGFNAAGAEVIGGKYDNTADYPIEYKVEKPPPLT